MSDTTESTVAPEHQALDYIRTNPDLLLRHPEILTAMHVPHRCGRAVSLVEHQVSVLKDSNRRLRRQLHELIDNATRNQDRLQRLLALSTSLLDCARLGEVITRLYRALGDDFQVDIARMRLFGEPPPERTGQGAVFVRFNDEARRLFDAVLSRGQPVCGRLQAPQLEFLFGEQLHNVGSSALLPLGHGGRLGLLAIGSHDPQRFHPAHGTEFLKNLGELVSRAVSSRLIVA